MSALKLLFMCVAFVSSVLVRFFFDVQCVSGFISNSVTATLYKSVTAKHLKAGSLYGPLLRLKKYSENRKNSVIPV